MSILQFLTRDQLEDLDEDPREAFLAIVQISQTKLFEEQNKLDMSQEQDWRMYEDFRYSFMSVIMASARRLEIEPFSEMPMPRSDDFRKKDLFVEFKAELDYYVTQMVLDSTARFRRDSVELLPRTKDQIKQYVHGLRNCLEKANLTDPKREALLKKLDEFEQALEPRRFNIMAATIVTLELLALPGGIWASGEVAHKLVSSIMQTVAEARAAEQETRRLPSPEPVKALLPPRRDERMKATNTPPKKRYDDLDDDIPF